MSDGSNPANLPDPGRWVALYGDYLYSFAFFRVQDAGVASDLVQETFLAALGSRTQFSGRSAPKTWFTAILKNKIQDHYRTVYSRESVLPESDLPESAVYDEDGNWRPEAIPQDWTLNPEQAAESSEFIAFLMKCLSRLPDLMRLVFQKKTLDDLPAETICLELSISESNIWVLLHRARHRVRRCLEVNYYGLK